MEERIENKVEKRKMVTSTWVQEKEVTREKCRDNSERGMLCVSEMPSINICCRVMLCRSNNYIIATLWWAIAGLTQIFQDLLASEHGSPVSSREEELQRVVCGSDVEEDMRSGYSFLGERREQHCSCFSHPHDFEQIQFLVAALPREWHHPWEELPLGVFDSWKFRLENSPEGSLLCTRHLHLLLSVCYWAVRKELLVGWSDITLRWGETW